MEAVGRKSPAGDGRILGLIGAGHFLSHFYSLTLPPLLILWRAEFDVGFTALGLVISLFAAANGLAQIPVGFLVDRIGARPVLFGGLVIEAVAIGAMGLAPDFETLLALAAVAGAGNSVFHPADYSILNSSISPERMGRAFSLHTFAGHLGSAAAPASIIFLAALRDWRFAMILVGVIGVAMAFLILTQGGALRADRIAKAKETGTDETPGEDKSGFALLLSKPLILFFLFYVFASLTSSGVTAFSVVAMVAIHDIQLASASTALTAYLFASALGVLIGGALADRTERHDLTAALAFIATAVIFAVMASVRISPLPIIAIFAVAGLVQGMVRPARDMMVRAIAPKGASGRVFAFVSTGIAAGSAVAPVFFGWIVDQGGSRLIFWLLAIFMIAATATLAGQKRAV